MKIDKIRVRDIRAHAKWEHEIEPGTVLLLGENGSGKSSVLMAMAYALFGWSSYKTKDMMRIGASSMRADVWFTHDGRSWRVAKGTRVNEMWAVRPGGDEESVATGATAVRAKVREALGQPPSVDLAKLYQDVLGGRQAAFTTGFNLRRVDRIRYWGTILELHRYRAAYEQLRGPVAALKGAIREYEIARNSYRQTLEGEDSSTQDLVGVVAALTTELKQIVDELAKAIAARASLEEQQRQAHAAVARMQVIEEGIKDKNRRVSVAQQSYKAAMERYSRYQVVAPKIDALAGWKAVYNEETVPGYEHLKHQVVLLQQTYDAAQVKAEEEKQRLEDLKAKAHRFSIVKLTLLGYQAEQAEQKRLRQKILDKIRELGEQKAAILLAPVNGGICPMCGNNLTAEEAAALNLGRLEQREELAGQMYDLTVELNELNKLQAETDREVSKLSVELGSIPTQDEVDTQTKWVVLVCESRDKGKVELDALVQKEIEQRPYAEAAVELKGWIDAAERETAEFVHYDRGEHGAADAELREAVDALHLAEVEVDGAAELLVRRGEVDAALEGARVEVERYQEQKEKEHQRLEELRRKVLIVEKIEAEEKALVLSQSRLDLLVRVREAINKAGPIIANRTVKRVAQVASQFWYRMGHSNALRWSGDFELSVGGRSFDMLSGGEQVAAALAIRLAIAAPHGLAFMCLDEPSVQLDEERRMALARIIVTQPLEQALVVSHDDTFALSANHVITFGQQYTL